jgi:phosphate transport system substrate-binding protein
MKNLTRILTGLTVVAALVFSYGCGKKVETPAEKTSIDIKGSDTMVNLMSALAEAYMKSHPGKNIAVTGGGSGTGIAAMLNGTTDICASSRALQDKEKELAKQKQISPQELVVGMDGLAVMVNPQNAIDTLTIDQIKQIFVGQYTDWQQVGGKPGPIVVLSRESNSGTYVYFKEHVLSKADYTPAARLMTSTAALVQEISTNNAAIGYGGEAYGRSGNVKMLFVKKDANSPAYPPREDLVLSQKYPIARPLFLYVNGQQTGLVKDFLDYCMTPEGQNIVREVGYVPMKG